MGLFSRNTVSNAADNVASVAIRAGRKVAGEKGADVANALTGSRYARCPQGCTSTDPNHTH